MKLKLSVTEANFDESRFMTALLWIGYSYAAGKRMVFTPKSTNLFPMPVFQE
jgi:hypothetical protein